MTGDWEAAYQARLAAMTPDERARSEINLSGMIIRMARAAGTAVLERGPHPGYTLTWTEAAPADGIRYALMLRNEASNQLGSYVRHARQYGMTWTAVGEALGLAGEAKATERPLGEVAFDYITDAEHARPFDTLSVYWTCPACGHGISDRGPFESHPEDNEHGHGEGCSRLAADIEAHETRMAEYFGED